MVRMRVAAILKHYTNVVNLIYLKKVLNGISGISITVSTVDTEIRKKSLGHQENKLFVFVAK